MPKRTITVKCDPRFTDGTIDKEIEADIKDGFAIHETINVPGLWTVTHVNSGLACGNHYDSKPKAQRARALLRQLSAGGVRLADMSTCEALNLFPIMSQQWVDMTKQEMTMQKQMRGIATRNYVAHVLDCQVQTTSADVSGEGVE